MPDRGRGRGFSDYEREKPRSRSGQRDEDWNSGRSERQGEGRRRMTSNRDERMSDWDQDERGGHRARRTRNGSQRDGLPLNVASALSDTYAAAIERSASLIGNNLRMLQDETLRFMTLRLEHDATVMEEMGRARNLFDLFSIQQRWLNDMATAYSQEFMRLGRLTANVAEDSMSAGRAVGERFRDTGEEIEEDVRERTRQTRGMSDQPYQQ